MKKKETIRGQDVQKLSKLSEDQPYFQRKNVYIYNANFLNVTCLDKSSIDLTITSPPYDVDVRYNAFNDKIPYKEYLEFTGNWLTKCYEHSKEDGRFCLNIPLDKNKGGQQSVYADIIIIAKKIGWKYHSTIVWNEQNISRRTAWGSWISASAPYIIAPVEMIAILYKKQWKKKYRGESDITRDEFIEWTNGVWNFMGESKKKIRHPSPFPVQLPRRCIKLFSYVGDTVLDPFLGSGTTLVACLQTGRRGIGLEIDGKYCEIAKQRLMKEMALNVQKLI